jgi:hemolysin-activating ACP:hemolysin acyltransferase
MHSLAGVNHRPRTEASTIGLRLFQPRNAVVALGLTVNYLMKRAPFDRLPFGEWSRVLVGQIDRGHYCFVVGENSRIEGFAGWALAGKADAEAWLAGSRDLSFEDCRQGDCVIFSAWAADGPMAHRFMVDHARRLIKDKQMMYFKRYYESGRVRLVRLKVNEFVVGHIARKSAFS